ncbi:ribonuclease P protein component [Clostridium oryzae]|uniref:Ribonuclease P protein component n=1 Tax=Clostridium oryzae TaxID=1450648 RepID=A0A1V4IFG7_9CLOT|nr:ribonuclease P protein component [Clostridium oryzae]OPJ58669.1 ribonuclease P protein component [Clostridium oryzae]
MKQERLRKNTDFKIAYRRGKSFSTELLVLYVYKNKRNCIDGSLYNRVGISVSKKVGKSVVRSRVKRLISECYRLNNSGIKNGLDLIFVSRVSSKDKSYEEIKNSMLKLFKKAGLYNNEENPN